MPRSADEQLQVPSYAWEMDDAEHVFNELTGELDYSMLIVTASAGARRAGCLVGFATQCSVDPPRYLVCLSERNRTFRIAEHSDALIVHYPGADQAALVELFGGETGDDTDKFARCNWHAGPMGMPLLDDCPRWFAGTILNRIPLGDHVGLVLAPFAAARGGGSDSFRFHRARRIDAGHDA
jgi:flavin reductase (DIM6/NTAB) family NADH-FMN oxidoreductase RutF